jgi:hypothetical protein
MTLNAAPTGLRVVEPTEVTTRRPISRCGELET